MKEQPVMTPQPTYQQTATTARGQAHTLFAQTMGYVAATAGLLAAFGLLVRLAVAPVLAYYRQTHESR
jgi:hypothetical protein